MRRDLLQVAIALLDEEGWPALRLERIAERAGVSRATVWRAGLTRSAIEVVLRQRLAADYGSFLGSVSTEGSGAERLNLALRALCQVAERNLPLLAHTDLAFHQPALDATGVAHDFFGPWLQILTTGRCDGSLPTVADPHRFVVALTDMVLLTYVHLRAHHAAYRWSPEQTTDHLLRLVATGYLPAETRTEADSNRDDTYL